MVKPNIPKEYRYVGSWHEENPKAKWFNHYTSKKHKGKKATKKKQHGKEGK